MQFNRQRPIGNYIADFYCAKAKLIIELDGITHHSEEQYSLDVLRQAELENMGYKVLRFSDEEVMKDRQNVLRTIEIELEKRFG